VPVFCRPCHWAYSPLTAVVTYYGHVLTLSDEVTVDLVWRRFRVGRNNFGLSSFFLQFSIATFSLVNERDSHLAVRHNRSASLHGARGSSADLLASLRRKYAHCHAVYKILSHYRADSEPHIQMFPYP